MNDARGYAHLGAALLTTTGSVAFAVNQNRGDVVGGPIHWSKAAWLNMTILTFIVLPAMWWRRGNISPAAKGVMRTLSLQFITRGAIEIPMIYFTRFWRCGFGISHDAAVFVLMGAQLVRDRNKLDLDRDQTALLFSAFAMSLLAIEGCFAKLFRQVQDPATGIYFADDSPKFRRVIRITKSVVFVAYPVLALLLWIGRKDFAPAEPPA